MLQSLFPLRDVISGASLCSSSLTYISRLPIFSFSSRRMHRGGRSGGRGRGLGNTASSRDSHSTSSSSQQGGGWGRGITAPSRYSHPTNSSSRQEADHHAKTFTSNELHMAEPRPYTPNRSPQCGSDILDENRYTRHYQGSSQDPSKPHHTESHGISSHCRCSFCPKSASPDQVQDHAKTFTSNELHMAERRPHTPNKSPQCGSDILDENRYTRHYQRSSQDPSKPHHTESHGISSHCRCSFCPKSASPDQVKDHRDEISRARKEEDHEKSQQVAQRFSPSMAKQENSPKFGAEDSSFSFGRPTNARHLPNISMSSNSPQNLNQVASHHSSLEASYSTWSGSGDKISKSRTPQPGRTSPKRAECADDKPVVPPFDIRLVKTGPIQLNPSLHTKNKEMIEHEKKRNNNQILRSGMVLLKNYLTEAEQVKIVRECRELGLKPGGFYQPGYKNGAKLHLHMMCLGKEWDPETRLYQEQRSVDGAKPPLIPNVFSELVSKAIKSSHSLIKENHKSSNPERELPCMEPDLCIVNFYSRNGKLGLHQDRDESSESLKNGLPVVSFSLGETAVFLYGDERDADKANKVQLESGDVLIYGGKSRHVFHGVPSIIPNSAPGFLANHLRPGRLNLTFRKY